MSRRYRNRRIGDFLKELKLVEGRNTGIPTILRAMEQNGSEVPIFKTDEERNYFTVVLPTHQKFQTKKESPQTKQRKSYFEVKALILSTLEEKNDLSTPELAYLMGYSKVTDTISRAVKELITEGKITYLDSKKIRGKKIHLI